MEKLPQLVAMLFLVAYPLWGIPALVGFDLLLVRGLRETLDPAPLFGVGLVASLVLFTPLESHHAEIMGTTYAPWYLALLVPPAPSFSWPGLLATAVVSSLTLGVRLALRGLGPA
jgi:hypothetical protein